MNTTAKTKTSSIQDSGPQAQILDKDYNILLSEDALRTLPLDHFDQAPFMGLENPMRYIKDNLNGTPKQKTLLAKKVIKMRSKLRNQMTQVA